LSGRIEINGFQPDFKETSSRDGGIIKNDSFVELKKFFMDKALRRLEKYVVEGIGWDSDTKPKTPEEIKEDSIRIIKEIVGQIKDPDKKIEFNENLLDIIEKKQVEIIPEAIKNIESLKKHVDDVNAKNYIDKQLISLKSATKTLQKTSIEKEQQVKSLKKDLQKNEDEILFLRAIAGEDKNEIIALQHQIGISTSNIENYLIFFKEKLSKGKEITKEELISAIERIILETKKISMVIRFVTKATFDLKREVTELDLPLFIKQYIEEIYVKNEAIVQNKNIDVTVKIDENFKLKGLFKPLEIAVIFDNMISNSIKAGAKRIEINVQKLQDRGIRIIIKDDGRGINPENVNNIFKFGFTTTNGSGIGLYHVKEIVHKMNGRIEFNHEIKKGAEFIIEIDNLRGPR
jgi:Signal transduction histidine kinase